MIIDQNFRRNPYEKCGRTERSWCGAFNNGSKIKFSIEKRQSRAKLRMFEVYNLTSSLVKNYPFSQTLSANT